VDVSFRSFLCAKENGHITHIGGGLVGGGCFFASFFAPKKVRDYLMNQVLALLPPTGRKNEVRIIAEN
jgi:hypothetical protein